MDSKNFKDLEQGGADDASVAYAEAVPLVPDAFDAQDPPAYPQYAYNPAVVNPNNPAMVEANAPPQQHQVVSQPTVVQPMAVQSAPGGPAAGQLVQQQLQLPNYWTTGCCECWVQLCPSCLCAFCCSCVLLAKITHKLRTHNYCCMLGGFFVVLAGQIVIMTQVLWLWVAAFYVCGFTMESRIKVRNHFRIPGNWCEDFFLSFFCNPCTLAQLARQIFTYRGVVDIENCDCRAPYGERL